MAQFSAVHSQHLNPPYTFPLSFRVQDISDFGSFLTQKAALPRFSCLFLSPHDAVLYIFRWRAVYQDNTAPTQPLCDYRSSCSRLSYRYTYSDPHLSSTLGYIYIEQRIRAVCVYNVYRVTGGRKQPIASQYQNRECAYIYIYLIILNVLQYIGYRDGERQLLDICGLGSLALVEEKEFLKSAHFDFTAIMAGMTRFQKKGFF